MRNREEHLEWCKQQAMEYWNDGKLQDAVASLLSDFDKHPETHSKDRNEYMIALGLICAMKNDADGVRRWIEGWR